MVDYIQIYIIVLIYDEYLFVGYRFPLRSKELSSQSKISNIPVTLDTVAELMKKFRQEMFDVLLFVNNLEEISVSDLSRTRTTVSSNYITRIRKSVLHDQI